MRAPRGEPCLARAKGRGARMENESERRIRRVEAAQRRHPTLPLRPPAQMGLPQRGRVLRHHRRPRRRVPLRRHGRQHCAPQRIGADCGGGMAAHCQLQIHSGAPTNCAALQARPSGTTTTGIKTSATSAPCTPCATTSPTIPPARHRIVQSRGAKGLCDSCEGIAYVTHRVNEGCRARHASPAPRLPPPMADHRSRSLIVDYWLLIADSPWEGIVWKPSSRHTVSASTSGPSAR